MKPGQPLAQQVSELEVSESSSSSDESPQKCSERLASSGAVPLPGHKIHRCTDKLWVAIFLAVLSGLLCTWQYAVAYGDIRRLYHGSDYLGRICGVDVEPAYLFWCRRLNRTAGEYPYERKHPICVTSCPQNGSTSHLCWDSHSGGQMDSHPDYPAKKIGKFCAPATAEAIDDLLSLVSQSSYSSAVHFILGVSVQARRILLLSTMASILTGCGYLMLVEKAPQAVLYMSMMMFGGIPLVSGYFILKAILLSDSGPSSSAVVYRNLAVGCCLVTVGTFTTLVSLSAHRLLRKAVGCIRATCECIVQEPTVLLQPFVALLMRAFLLMSLAYGFLHLVSIGTLGNHGMKKNFEYTPLQIFLIVYYIFATVWLMGFCTALSQYCLSWVTQRWYFTPYIHGKKEDLQACGILEGFVNAMTFHLGSLAFGSLLQSLGGWPFFCFLFLSAVCRHDFCCTERCRTWMSTKNVYMDIALTSDRFAVAAVRSRDILSSQGQTVVTLNGAQWVYFTTGMVSITSAGVLLSQFLLENCSSCVGPDYKDYADPVTIGIFAAVLCFYVGETFMTVFDVVGDTILYCLLLDQARKREIQELRVREECGGEDSQTWAGWLFSGGIRCAGDGSYVPEYFDADVTYTPLAVRDLIPPAPRT